MRQGSSGLSRHVVLLLAAAVVIVGQVEAAVDRGLRPNIVLIAVDTLRADHLSCYGSPRQTTPHIDRLAAEGVLFEQTFSPANWTLPAFASIFTGVGPSAHECVGFHGLIPPTLPNLTESLRQKGYYCAAVVSNPFLNAKYGFGRGFDQYDDYSVFLEEELASLSADGAPKSTPLSELVTGHAVTARAKQLLVDAIKSTRPFFLFIHYFDPHDSYVPPHEFRSRFEIPYEGPVTGRGVSAMRLVPMFPKDMDQLTRLYDGEVAYDDSQVGDFLDALDATVDPSRTMIILLSDHGEAFGEHGALLHGNSAHVEETRVPMIWRWKGRFKAGHRGKEPVSTLDLWPTLQALIAPDASSAAQIEQGESLISQLRGEAGHADRVVISEGAQVKHFAAIQGTLRTHVRFVDNPTEAHARIDLFDLAADPLESKPLSASVPPAGVREAINAYWCQCRGLAEKHRPKAGSVQVQLSASELRRIEGLGYTSTAATQPATQQTKADQP